MKMEERRSKHTDILQVFPTFYTYLLTVSPPHALAILEPLRGGDAFQLFEGRGEARWAFGCLGDGSAFIAQGSDLHVVGGSEEVDEGPTLKIGLSAWRWPAERISGSFGEHRSR